MLSIMNQIQTGILLFLITSLLSGCLQQSLTYSDNDGDENTIGTEMQKPIVWGGGSYKSLYLDPMDYYKQDPLGYLLQPHGQMVRVLGGSFMMGGGNFYKEKPIHQVKVKTFWLGKYEVTQKQWYEVMGSNPSYFDTCNNCPVEQVSWQDVQDFIKRLNQQTGKSYRLPTEAEWEYACRSGGKNEKYCGGNQDNSLAWYRENSGKESHHVGRKSPNGLGLYDMSGNVFEWVQDCWYLSYDGAPSNGEARNRNNSDCTYRVLRGGSWFGIPNHLSSTNRDGFPLTYSSDDGGFRLAHD